MVTKIFANAVAKYNEGKLLDSEKLYRLADAEFPDAVKMLYDYGYGDGAVDEKSYDIDAFISRETTALIDYVLTNAPNKYLARMLTNRFFYGNAKAYYKARVMGKLNESAVYKTDDEAVRQGIERGEYAALPTFMAEACLELDKEFSEREPDPKAIDIAFTRATYADNLYCAKKAHSYQLKKFVVGEIDLGNIITAFRAGDLGVSEEGMIEMYIGGGRLSIDDICVLYSAEDRLSALRDTCYDYLVDDVTAVDLPWLEAQKDEMLSLIWEKSAENMLSYSPFVTYFLSQMAEYKTVKMILTCLKNDAREEILPRLRKHL